MSSSQGKLIFDIKRFALHDGPGIRTTAFLKGCPLSCVWCQNPEGINSNPLLWYTESQCIKCADCIEVCPHEALTSNAVGFISIDRKACTLCGLCVDECPSGALHWDSRSYSPQELFERLERDAVFYDSSGGGITLSGGEPLLQPDFSLEVLKLCRDRGLHTAIETSLYSSPSVLERFQPFVDLFLADLKLIDNHEHQEFTGVPNKPILKNMTHLVESGQVITVRVPLIPGITDTHRNIAGIAQFLRDLGGDVPVELLNFNPLAESKYRALDRPYRFADTHAQLSAERIEQLKTILRESGCRVV